MASNAARGLSPPPSAHPSTSPFRWVTRGLPAILLLVTMGERRGEGRRLTGAAILSILLLVAVVTIDAVLVVAVNVAYGDAATTVTRVDTTALAVAWGEGATSLLDTAAAVTVGVTGMQNPVVDVNVASRGGLRGHLRATMRPKALLNSRREGADGATGARPTRRAACVGIAPEVVASTSARNARRPLAGQEADGVLTAASSSRGPEPTIRADAKEEASPLAYARRLGGLATAVLWSNLGPRLTAPPDPAGSVNDAHAAAGVGVRAGGRRLRVDTSKVKEVDKANQVGKPGAAPGGSAAAAAEEAHDTVG